MPFISKIQRQSDYNLFDSNTPLVIDNGASYFRIGYSTILLSPTLIFTVPFSANWFFSVNARFGFRELLSGGRESLNLVLFFATLCKGRAIK